MLFVFFFFKHKTAYEMRISDWSRRVLFRSIHEFINLMDGNGELVFSDRQAHRMERAMANMEFGFGEGGYQPSEFIKRQLPQGTRSEEHTSELQSLMRISYAVFCLKKKNTRN